MTLRSSIYLQGSKKKLYPQIKPYLQDGKRKVLVDLFGGSGTMTLNCVNDNMFDKYIYNDKSSWLYDMQSYLKEYDNCTEIHHDLTEYFDYYNNRRPHQALNMLSPSQVYFTS